MRTTSARASWSSASSWTRWRSHNEPATLGACAGIALPGGRDVRAETDVKTVYAQGQSMGGMYTNLIGASSRNPAALPTGAGGYWSHFILITPLIPGVAGKVGVALLGTTAKLTFMHPGLNLFQTAAEAVDPMVSMPRLARRPLKGHPVRPVAACRQGQLVLSDGDVERDGARVRPQTGGRHGVVHDAGRLEAGGAGGARRLYPVADDVTSEGGAGPRGWLCSTREMGCMTRTPYSGSSTR